MEKNIKKLSHFFVQQKLTQYILTIFQSKKAKKKWIYWAKLKLESNFFKKYEKLILHIKNIIVHVHIQESTFECFDSLNTYILCDL